MLHTKNWWCPFFSSSGFPNVGKSSVINSLVGRKVVSVSRTPGHTKYFQTYYLTPTVKLCDCPGLVFPSRVNKQLQVQMHFCVLESRCSLFSTNFTVLHSTLLHQLGKWIIDFIHSDLSLNVSLWILVLCGTAAQLFFFENYLALSNIINLFIFYWYFLSYLVPLPLFLWSIDSGRHLPSFSAAGALQLSWLSVREDPLSLSTEA